MAKWIFTRPGSWDYPTLGFRATAGDVCEADLAPDAWWDATDSGATVTVPIVPTAGIDEDLNGAVLVYNASTNKDERKLPAAAGLLTEASADARINARALKNAKALRPWVADLKAGGSRSFIFGHSVVAGSGASTTPQRFTSIVAAAIEAVDATATVTVDGNSGYTSSQLWDDYDSAGTGASFTSLTIFMCLLNDYYYDVDPETTRSNLTNLIAKMKAIQPGGSDTPAFLIVLEWLRGDVPDPAYSWDAYRQVAYDVAYADDSVALLDLGALMGDAADDALGQYAADDAHPSDLGHAVIAQHILDLLGVDTPPEPSLFGKLLGATIYRPTSVTTKSTTGTSASNVDSTNPGKVGVVFTAESTSVWVRLTATAYVTAGGSYRWALRFMSPSGAADAANTTTEVCGSPGGQYLSVSRVILVTGLTAGVEYGLTWAHLVNSGSHTGTFVAGAHTGAAVMEVYDTAGVTATT